MKNILKNIFFSKKGKDSQQKHLKEKFNIPPQIALDADDITDNGIIRGGEKNHIQARIGVMISLHFLHGWERYKREAVLAMAEEYISLFPEDVTHYKLPGEKRYRKLPAPELPEAYKKIPEMKEDEKGYIFLIEDDSKEPDTPPLWLFWGTNYSKAQAEVFPNGRSDRPVSGIKVHFPPNFLFDDPDRFVDLVTRWSNMVSALHGTAGLAAISLPGTEKYNLYNYPLAKAFPALDYDNRGMFWVEIRYGNWENVRTSNWLTILGDGPISRIGGMDVISQAKTGDMTLIPYDGGAVVRACTLPALGDEATGGIPEGYRIAARLIKPIRFEGYNWGSLFGYQEEDKENKAQLNHDWIRRFD